MNAGVFPQAHCRRRCWFAQGNVCRCACGGENHGSVRPNGKRADTKSPGNPGQKKSNGKNSNGKKPKRKKPDRQEIQREEPKREEPDYCRPP